VADVKRFVCEVTPHANSPSPELALEIAPLIHSELSTPFPDAAFTMALCSS
jgi:hypothetical protein